MAITFDALLFGNWEYSYKADNYDEKIFKDCGEKHYLIVMEHDEQKFYQELKKYGLFDEYVAKNFKLDEPFGNETLV